MKPDYKNWMPKGMIYGGAVITILFLILFIVFGCTGIVSGTLKTVLFIVLLILTLLACVITIWMILMYRAFSYDGKRQMSKQIIDGVASYVSVPDGGKILDVGCGSGALAIACAKRNPNAEIIGIDRWGKEYASFSRQLCERNARAEKVNNTKFQQGDAVKLDFADETFDAVMSNYVYHNIAGQKKQQLLLETLRVLKKGGSFAIHDLMSRARYGDMDAFVQKLRDEGYEDVRLIDTTDGRFMGRKEAALLGLGGSTLLVGRK